MTVFSINNFDLFKCCHRPVIARPMYLISVTHPRSQGRLRTGFDTRIGLKMNLQPKLRAQSLKKETVTSGRSNMWGGSMWDTMQPPGW